MTPLITGFGEQQIASEKMIQKRRFKRFKVFKKLFEMKQWKMLTIVRIEKRTINLNFSLPGRLMVFAKIVEPLIWYSTPA